MVEILLTNAEIPAIALGKGDSGTSGSSGLAIKFRMNSLLAKINRKRQFYDKGLKELLITAQMLEHAKLGSQVNSPTTLVFVCWHLHISFLLSFYSSTLSLLFPVRG